MDEARRAARHWIMAGVGVIVLGLALIPASLVLLRPYIAETQQRSGFRVAMNDGASAVTLGALIVGALLIGGGAIRLLQLRRK